MKVSAEVGSLSTDVRIDYKLSFCGTYKIKLIMISSFQKTSLIYVLIVDQQFGFSNIIYGSFILNEYVINNMVL